MTVEVGFSLVTDSAPFLAGIADASKAQQNLINETKSFEAQSKTAFKDSASEVSKFTTGINDGIKGTTSLSKEVDKLGATKSAVIQLKQEIKFYTSEALKAGAGTKAFADNLAKAGKLKDELADLNKAVGSLNGNMGENFARAAGGSIGLVSKGFEGLTALQVLAGQNNKTFEQTLLRLQSLNAIASIAQQFAGLKDTMTEIKLGFGSLFQIIKANPLGAFIALITLAGAAFIYLKDKLNSFADSEENRYKKLLEDSEKYIDSLKEQYQFQISVLEASGKRTEDLEKEKTKVLKNEILIRIDALQKLNQINGELNEDQLKQQEQLTKEYEDLLSQDIIRTRKLKTDQEKLIKDSNNKITDLNISLIKDNEQREIAQARKRADDQVNEISERAKMLFGENKGREIIQAEAFKIFDNSEKEITGIREKYSKERNDKLKALEFDLYNAILDLTKRTEAAQLQSLTGEARIEAEKQFALKEIAELKKKIIEKGQLEENFEAELQHRKAKQYELDIYTLSQFSQLEQTVYAEATQKLIQLEVDRQNEIAKAKSDNAAKSLSILNTNEQSDINTVNSIAKPKGMEDVDFEAQKQIAIIAIQKKYAEERLQVEKERIAAERTEKIKGLNGELELIGNGEDAETKRKRAAVLERVGLTEKEYIAIQNSTDTAYTALNAKLDQELAKLTAKKPFDLADALGISKNDLTAITGAINNVASVLNSTLQTQLNENDTRIKKSKDTQSQYQSEIDALQSKLDAEKQANNEGKASNIDRINKEILAKEAAQKKEQQNENIAIARKKEIEKEQLLANSIAEASNLFVAASQIYAQTTLATGALGVPVAAIAISAMIAGFAASKIAALKAINEGNNFAEGVFQLDGPGTETSDSIRANLSKGESVFSAKKTRENHDLLKGLFYDDKQLMHDGILDLIKGKGINLIPDLQQSLVAKRNEIRNATTNHYVSSDNKQMEQELAEMNNRFAELLKKQSEKTYLDSSGNLVRQMGSHTQIIQNGKL